MFQAFVMVLREGFESFLIVAIIVSYLRATGRIRLLPAVYIGILVSLGLSVLLGYFLFKGVNGALWEAILGLVTVLMVGTLVVHMWRVGPQFKAEIQNQLRQVSLKDSGSRPFLWVFIFTVFMMTREGMETALLLLQVRDQGVLAGIFLGLGAAVLVAWIWGRYGHLINSRRFFQVTGLFLLLFLVQVAIYSLHEFSESGIIPNSEAFHVATEPFSPVGIYGQWFSLAMVSVCTLWLALTWAKDRIRSVKKSQAH